MEILATAVGDLLISRLSGMCLYLFWRPVDSPGRSGRRLEEGSRATTAASRAPFPSTDRTPLITAWVLDSEQSALLTVKLTVRDGLDKGFGRVVSWRG